MNPIEAGILSERKPVWILFNPFIYIAGASALVVGVAAILAAGVIGYFSRTHFDGVIDVHTGRPAPFWFFLSEGIVDWLCMGTVLVVSGKLASKTSFRLLDVMGTQALARWPSVLLSLITLPPAYQRFTNQMTEQFAQGRTDFAFNTADGIVFLVTVLLTVPILCWMVYLMYKAYSVSCNVKGGRGVGTFIPALIIAEILSKFAFAMLLKWV